VVLHLKAFGHKHTRSCSCTSRLWVRDCHDSGFTSGSRAELARQPSDRIRDMSFLNMSAEYDSALELESAQGVTCCRGDLGECAPSSLRKGFHLLWFVCPVRGLMRISLLALV